MKNFLVLCKHACAGYCMLICVIDYVATYWPGESEDVKSVDDAVKCPTATCAAALALRNTNAPLNVKGIGKSCPQISALPDGTG